VLYSTAAIVTYGQIEVNPLTSVAERFRITMCSVLSKPLSGEHQPAQADQTTVSAYHRPDGPRYRPWLGRVQRRADPTSSRGRSILLPAPQNPS
jgi:hypothetical protein